MERPLDGPAILRCPRGEEWPSESFKSSLDYRGNVVTHDSIHIWCPAGHEFTLKKAVEKGMLTPEEGLKIIASAQKQLPELRKEAQRIKRANPGFFKVTPREKEPQTQTKPGRIPPRKPPRARPGTKDRGGKP